MAKLYTNILVFIAITAASLVALDYTEVMMVAPKYRGMGSSDELSMLTEIKEELKFIKERMNSLPLPSPTPTPSPSPSPTTSPSPSPSPSPTPTPNLPTKPQPILDLYDFPSLVGPRTTPIDKSKNLVVICIGKSDKEMVNKLITKTFSAHDQFSFMLFHYDNSTWHEFEWYSQLNVVAIRVLHKMKFWYIKRFLSPNMARAFKHIIILDADVDFQEPFDPLLYLKVADSFNLDLSQPAHFKETTTLHPSLPVRDGEHMGRYTDFIECGPAAIFSSRGYQCVYDLLQEDLTSGWGVDILWVDYLRNTCGFGNDSVAIFDAFVLIHDTPSSQGTASSNPGFNAMAWGELLEFIARFPNVTVGWGLSGDRSFGFRSCVNAINPAQNTKCS